MWNTQRSSFYVKKAKVRSRSLMVEKNMDQQQYMKNKFMEGQNFKTFMTKEIQKQNLEPDVQQKIKTIGSIKSTQMISVTQQRFKPNQAAVENFKNIKEKQIYNPANDIFYQMRFLNDLNNEKEKKQTFKLKSKPKLGLNYDKVIKKFSQQQIPDQFQVNHTLSNSQINKIINSRHIMKSGESSLYLKRSFSIINKDQ